MSVEWSDKYGGKITPVRHGRNVCVCVCVCVCVLFFYSSLKQLVKTMCCVWAGGNAGCGPGEGGGDR